MEMTVTLRMAMDDGADSGCAIAMLARQKKSGPTMEIVKRDRFIISQ